MVAGHHVAGPARPGRRVTTSASGAPSTSASYVDGTPRRCSTPERGGGVALRVEVDHQDPLAELGQRRRDVDGRRGLADAALLVGDHDDPGRVRPLQRRPHQRALPRQHDVLGRPGERGAVVVERRCRTSRDPRPSGRTKGRAGAVSRETTGSLSPRAWPVEERDHPVDNYAQRATRDRWITRWTVGFDGGAATLAETRRPRPQTVHSTPMPPLLHDARSASTPTLRRRRRPCRRPPTYPRRIGPGHPDRRRGGESIRRRRACSTSGGAQASCRSVAAAATISSWIEDPFIATSAPVRRHQRHRPAQEPLQGSHGPGGDHVERAPTVQLLGPAPDHLDPAPRPSSATTSSRNVVRRSSGSTSVIRRSGRATASTRPGQAGAGADVADGRIRRAAARPARRSSAGAGPTAAAPRAGRSGPRTTPSVASSSAYRSASGSRSHREHPPRRLRRGGLFHVKHRPSTASARAGPPRSGGARRPRTPR